MGSTSQCRPSGATMIRFFIVFPRSVHVGYPQIEIFNLFYQRFARHLIQTYFFGVTKMAAFRVSKPESTEGGCRVSVLKRQEGAPVLLG